MLEKITYRTSVKLNLLVEQLKVGLRVLACLFQARKCVPATLTESAARTTTDLSPFYVLSDLPFTQVVMERQPRILQNQQ